ncbi:MAG: hypothetical protein NVV74_25330 [Magnetospirillum sp.]|nr:hypothetical protein [Magnetospirillum sp.]
MTRDDHFHLIIFDRKDLHDECAHLFAEYEQASPSLVGELWDLCGMEGVYGRTFGDVWAGAQGYVTTILTADRHMGLLVVEDRLLAHLLLGDNRPIFHREEGDFNTIAKHLVRMWAIRENDRLHGQMMDLYALASVHFGVHTKDDWDQFWADSWNYLSGGGHPGEVEVWP